MRLGVAAVGGEVSGDCSNSLIDLAYVHLQLRSCFFQLFCQHLLPFDHQVEFMLEIFALNAYLVSELLDNLAAELRQFLAELSPETAHHAAHHFFDSSKLSFFHVASPLLKPLTLGVGPSQPSVYTIQ
jgi:hypothetical protein